MYHGFKVRVTTWRRGDLHFSIAEASFELFVYTLWLDCVDLGHSALASTIFHHTLEAGPHQLRETVDRWFLTNKSLGCRIEQALDETLYYSYLMTAVVNIYYVLSQPDPFFLLCFAFPG